MVFFQQLEVLRFNENHSQLECVAARLSIRKIPSQLPVATHQKRFALLEFVFFVFLFF